MTTLLEELIEEAVDAIAADEADELNEALALGLSTGRLEAVCPGCKGVMSNYAPGDMSACCYMTVYPEDVIYRIKEPS